MFKKGHVPHNKGDTLVRANFRNKPKKKMMKKRMPKKEQGYNSEMYNTKLGNNFMKWVQFK